MALLREALVPPVFQHHSVVANTRGGSFHVAQPQMGATANSLDNR